MIFIYKIVLYVLLIPALPVLSFVWLFSSKRRANLMQRFSFKTGLFIPETGKKRIWIHALSVGEVISSVPFVKAVKRAWPSCDVVFTASTKTGFETAEKLLRTGGHPPVDHLGYFPFDIGFCINRLRKKIQPDAVVIVETDLWPNFLYEMKKHRIPVVLINARMSERSLKGYLFFKKFSAWFFGFFAEIMAQSEQDRQRFETLGISSRKITVTGNIKFDQPRPDLAEDEIPAFKKQLGILPQAQVLIGGSTHTGEEKILLDIYENLKKRFDDLILILAPRDPKRADEIEALCRARHMHATLLSDTGEINASARPADIILVDRMGVLAKLYAVCSASFIGGSMVKRGGHNPLEAAAFSKPVFFGGDMSDFSEISSMLTAAGAAEQISSPGELENRISTLLENRDLQHQMGRAGFNLFSSHSGAVQNIITRMEMRKIV